MLSIFIKIVKVVTKMNEDLIKWRGKYELLNDDLDNLCAQIATEAKEIAEWANKFAYIERSMGKVILKETKQDADKANIIKQRIERLSDHHEQATFVLAEIDFLKPLVKK